MSGFTASDPAYAARIAASFARQDFMTLIGARLARVEPGLCEVRLAFDPRLTQQHGLFHGGVTGAIADTAAGYAAFSLMPADSAVLTTEYKINLIAPARGEELIAQARVLKPGRTLSVVVCEVAARHGDDETPVAHLLATMMCLHGKSDNPLGKVGAGKA